MPFTKLRHVYIGPICYVNIAFRNNKCMIRDSPDPFPSLEGGVRLRLAWFPDPSFVRMHERGKEGSGKCLYPSANPGI